MLVITEDNAVSFSSFLRFPRGAAQWVYTALQIPFFFVLVLFEAFTHFLPPSNRFIAIS